MMDDQYRDSASCYARSPLWQRVLMLVFGAWLFCSPIWIYAYQVAGTAAVWNSQIVGATLFVLAVLALYRPRPWQAPIGLAIGCWLVIAPFVLDLSSTSGGATSNQMLVGVLVGLNALGMLVGWRCAIHGERHKRLYRQAR